MKDAERARRKRLGQFFSGLPLARLLAALAGAGAARAIVDPMGGSGDMLAACLLEGAAPDALAAIEIDPAAAAACRERMDAAGAGAAAVVRGDAFDRRSWPDPGRARDLAITNPPYVRYQAGSAPGPAGAAGAAAVRESLLGWIGGASHLGERGRREFRAYARSYSGLADLAVPAWILCAASLGAGGRLAIVAPPGWLSREYAAPVLRMLRRRFEIECVAEDADGSWFPGALVRPALIVARRAEGGGSARPAGGHLRVRLPAAAGDGRSLVGRAFPDADRPEAAFAEWARSLRAARAGGTRGPIRASWSDGSDLRRAAYAGARPAGRAPRGGRGAGSPIPERMRQAAGEPGPGLAALADLGWRAGQGLRTGANGFFYVRARGRGRHESALLPGEPLRLPAAAVRTAAWRQADLPDGTLAPADGGARVLALERWALPEDAAGAAGPRPWREMRGGLARLVRTAGAAGPPDGPLPRRSAVRTNVRAGRPDAAARFWYQLPPFAERHRPALYVPRVNSAHPVARLNPGRALVIDANFATLWPERGAAVSPEAMLALLNSAWTRCFLGLTAAVLGGGALKVEAAHLRRLLTPRPDGRAARRLHALGGELAARGLAPDLEARIDEALLDALPGGGPAAAGLRALARSLPAERAPRAAGAAR